MTNTNPTRVLSNPSTFEIRFTQVIEDDNLLGKPNRVHVVTPEEGEIVSLERANEIWKTSLKAGWVRDEDRERHYAAWERHHDDLADSERSDRT